MRSLTSRSTTTQRGLSEFIVSMICTTNPRNMSLSEPTLKSWTTRQKWQCARTWQHASCHDLRVAGHGEGARADGG